MYSRLLICKEIGAENAREKHASLLANPVAIELGLDEPSGPSVILAQAIEAVGATAGAGGSSEEPNVLYLYFLDACEKVFANELDQATFEEHMRWFFRTKVGARSNFLVPALSVCDLFHRHSTSSRWTRL